MFWRARRLTIFAIRCTVEDSFRVPRHNFDSAASFGQTKGPHKSAFRIDAKCAFVLSAQEAPGCEFCYIQANRSILVPLIARFHACFGFQSDGFHWWDRVPIGKTITGIDKTIL